MEILKVQKFRTGERPDLYEAHRRLKHDIFCKELKYNLDADNSKNLAGVDAFDKASLMYIAKANSLGLLGTSRLFLGPNSLPHYNLYSGFFHHLGLSPDDSRVTTINSLCIIPQARSLQYHYKNTEASSAAQILLGESILDSINYKKELILLTALSGRSSRLMDKVGFEKIGEPFEINESKIMAINYGLSIASSTNPRFLNMLDVFMIQRPSPSLLSKNAHAYFSHLASNISA